MAINSKMIKVLVATILIIATSIWVYNSVRPRNYEGTSLAFMVQRGVVEITNPAEPTSVQFLRQSSSSFRMVSPTDGVGGTSVREGVGNEAFQILDVLLPTGTTEFTTSINANVQFESNTESSLSARVYPLNAGSTRFRLVALGLFVLMMLFYISYEYDHAWLNVVRGGKVAEDTAKHTEEQENFDRIMQKRVDKKRP